MRKKLTLSIDSDLIKFAHDFASKTNQSISKIVEEYFIQLKKQESEYFADPKIDNLYGIFEDKPVPDKKKLRKIFYDKSDYWSKCYIGFFK